MQDNKQPINQPVAAGGLVPDIVKEIPLATPDAKTRPPNDDDELDKIMRDVGSDLRQVGQKKPKHHWFGKGEKAKAEPKFSARSARPAAVAPPPKPTAAPPKPASAATKSVEPAKAKPAKTSQAPVGIVVLAMIVTCGLIAAAYYAYK